MNSFDRDSIVAYEVENIYEVSLNRKGLLSPELGGDSYNECK